MIDVLEEEGRERSRGVRSKLDDRFEGCGNCESRSLKRALTKFLQRLEGKVVKRWEVRE